MKKDIHPTYYPNATVKCACGNTFTVGSTHPSLEIEACSACHPFYTGQDKLMDKVGRVQKFRERLAKKSASAPSTSLRASADKQTKKQTAKKKQAETKQKGRVRVTAKKK